MLLIDAELSLIGADLSLVGAELSLIDAELSLICAKLSQRNSHDEECNDHQCCCSNDSYVLHFKGQMKISMHYYWAIACHRPEIFNCAVIPEKCQNEKAKMAKIAFKKENAAHRRLKPLIVRVQNGSFVKNFMRRFIKNSNSTTKIAQKAAISGGILYRKKLTKAPKVERPRRPIMHH